MCIDVLTGKIKFMYQVNSGLNIAPFLPHLPRVRFIGRCDLYVVQAKAMPPSLKFI